jgi:hypothetical protein
VTETTGTGKTFLACTLTHQACQQEHRARYWPASRLFQACALARADGTHGRLLGQFARMDVLVIDDFALVPLQDAQRRDLLEILEDRYGTRSTIVTSQLDPKLWHQAIGDPTLADAICDRLLHNAHRLMLKGPSRRNGRTARLLSQRPNVAPLRSDGRRSAAHTRQLGTKDRFGERRKCSRANRRPAALRADPRSNPVIMMSEIRSAGVCDNRVKPPTPPRGGCTQGSGGSSLQALILLPPGSREATRKSIPLPLSAAACPDLYAFR